MSHKAGGGGGGNLPPPSMVYGHSNSTLAQGDPIQSALGMCIRVGPGVSMDTPAYISSSSRRCCAHTCANSPESVVLIRGGENEFDRCKLGDSEFVRGSGESELARASIGSVCWRA